MSLKRTLSNFVNKHSVLTIPDLGADLSTYGNIELRQQHLKKTEQLVEVHIVLKLFYLIKILTYSL